MNDQQDSLNAYRERRITERARVAKLVLVALVAGFVGAGWGYVKGEVAVLTGDSEVASVLLAPAADMQVAGLSVAVPQTSSTSTTTSTNPTGGATPSNVPGTSVTTPSCDKGDAPYCRNRCAGAFVDIGQSGTTEVKIDCYEADTSDQGAKKAIEKLETCISEAYYTAEFLKQNLCLVDKPIGATYAEKGAAAPAPESKKATSITIPTECKQYYDAVIKLRSSGKKTSVDRADASKCADVGASVCYSNPAANINATSSSPAIMGSTKVSVGAVSGSGYKCEPKPSSGQGGDTTKPDTKSKYEQLKECMSKGAIEGLKCAGSVLGGNNNGPSGPSGPSNSNNNPTNGVRGGSGMPMMPQQQPQSSGSGSGSGAPKPQCPAGYVLSNQQPQTSSSTGQTLGVDQYGVYSTPTVYQNSTYVCIPANQANAQPPQCTFNVSKKNPTKGEKVTLTWSTSNTDNGGKVMLSDGTNSGKIETSGTQDVTISSPRTYTLTAYNAKGQTKECKVEITLGGTGEEGTSGAYPPKLSCAPSIIEAGKSATVTWECPTAAKKSAGEGTTTGGAVKGQKTVTPTTNSEYTVSCFSSDTANIDDEESEDFLGKRTCSVRVAKPEFDIIAYPEQAKRGERVRISWGSLFMKTCKVSGPRGFDYTRPNGVVVTEPFSTNEQTAPDRTIRAAVYTITCESLFGKTYSADTEVDFQN